MARPAGVHPYTAPRTSTLPTQLFELPVGQQAPIGREGRDSTDYEEGREDKAGGLLVLALELGDEPLRTASIGEPACEIGQGDLSIDIFRKGRGERGGAFSLGQTRMCSSC
jgi:hypothetical protein